VALNIKNEEVAVREAIRERLEHIRGNSKKDLVERVLEISRDCAPRFKETLQVCRPWRLVV
jgi:hypothetical protein